MLRHHGKWLIATGLSGTMALVGCGSRATPETSKPPETPPAATSAARPTTAESAQSVTMADRVGTSRTGNVAERDVPFDEKIVRDMLQASGREALGDVNGAHELWQSIQQRLLSQYGPDSWQVRSADVASQQLRQRMAFDLNARTRLVEIADLERRGDRRASEGDAAAALALYSDALAMAAEIWGDDSSVTLALRRKLAARQEETGDTVAALTSYLAVLDGRTRLFGADHPYTLDSLGDLARFHQHGGRFDLAVQQASKRLAGCRTIWGASASQTAEALNDLGTIYYDAGDFSRASRELDAALTIRRSTLGSTDPAVAHSLRNLALVRIAESRMAEAESLLTEAIELLTQVPEPAVVAELSVHRGTCRLAQQNLEGAESDYRAACATFGDMRQVSPLPYASACFKHGYVLGRLGRYPEAAPLLTQALEIQRRMLSSDNPALQKTEEILALVNSKPAGVRVGDQGGTLR